MYTAKQIGGCTCELYCILYDIVHDERNKEVELLKWIYMKLCVIEINSTIAKQLFYDKEPHDKRGEFWPLLSRKIAYTKTIGGVLLTKYSLCE